ncbi:MAG: DUF368 domain-containing protein [Phycisphaerales bacterium]|nr:DUF368 domain-containing protein [Phycisphaerales bacterium]
MENQQRPSESTSKDPSPKQAIPWFRCGIGGVLMGLANLVPGVSGGTMILIIGLYDDFISSVADITRLKFTRRSFLIVGMIGGIAILSIAMLAGQIGKLMDAYPLAMYSLFIGMTLGGVPMLWQMVKPLNPGSILPLMAGIAVMVVIALTTTGASRLSDEEKASLKERVKSGEFILEPNYALDIAAGVLGMSAMVLPGVSGAYMLLLLGRYRQILGAIAAAKTYVLSFGKEGDLTWLQIVLPVGIGVLVSVIGVTNILKWLLHHHERPTVALLLGILVGSAVLLFGKVNVQTGGDYATAGGLLLVGLVLTLALGRVGDGEKTGKS